MREVYKNGAFDYVFNLFTSFGYFESDDENLQVVQSMYADLEEEGTLIIDFMNSHKVINQLVAQEKKTIDDIDFHIERFVENGFIRKKIEFSDQGKDYSFMESVRALSRSQFEELFEKAGFKIHQVYGDYELNAFDLENSDRLIFVCKR